MKVSKVFLALTAVSILFLSGCASTKTIPTAKSEHEEVKLSCAYASGVVDGKTVTACAVDAQEIDPKTGKNNQNWKRSVQVYDNEPTAASVVKIGVGTIVPAVIQGEYGKAMAREHASSGCRTGNCGTLIVNETNSGAVANSLANSTTDVDIKALKDFVK